MEKLSETAVRLKIAFDIDQMRPGCSLLQAAYGCPPNLADLFPIESWLLEPSEGLRVYNIERQQLTQLIEKTREFQEKRLAQPR